LGRGVVVVIVGGVTIERLSVLDTLPARFVACTAKEKLPAALGVPEITPALEIERPVGRLDPGERLQEMGIKPEPDKDWE